MDPVAARELLCRAEAAGASLAFFPFYGHRRSGDRVGPEVLSNWWHSPFVYASEHFETAEAALMWEKARLFGDLRTAARLPRTADPATAKRLGRQVRGYDDVRWSAVRFELMVGILEAKFSADVTLAAYLTSFPERVFVEASPSDRVWGVGLRLGDRRVSSPRSWLGENLLGFALTEVAASLSGLPSPLDLLPAALPEPPVEQLGLF